MSQSDGTVSRLSRVRISFPVLCFCSTSGGVIPSLTEWFVMTKEGAMKALALLTAGALTLLSVAGCAQYDGYYGTGKAPPPPPVVTKG